MQGKDSLKSHFIRNSKDFLGCWFGSNVTYILYHIGATFMAAVALFFGKPAPYQMHRKFVPGCPVLQPEHNLKLLVLTLLRWFGKYCWLISWPCIVAMIVYKLVYAFKTLTDIFLLQSIIQHHELISLAFFFLPSFFLVS